MDREVAFDRWCILAVAILYPCNYIPTPEQAEKLYWDGKRQRGNPEEHMKKIIPLLKKGLNNRQISKEIKLSEYRVSALVRKIKEGCF